MGRAPCCSKVGLHRGPWTAREDKLLINYIRANGEGHWRSLPKKAGLLRCGKSCRLRWMNYLRPDIKRGNITPDEEDLIIRLHSLLGNRWSLIAGRLPGRTDNEIKNYWNSHLSKRFKNKEKCSTSTTDHHQPIRKSSEKKMKGNQENGNGDTTKTTKIHLPKAVRVSSVSVASIGARIGDDDLLRSSIWSGFNKAAGNEDGGDLACGYLSSCLDCMPANDHNMLDEMFDEYDQLLNTDNYGRLDSFIDSLLA